ncbi:MAG: 30S ribosomal protein S17 [Candidatus Phytoplasma cynodontis]|uniref:30S ribosomal protein S17 n=1 Tax='Cynodon dactylon' phytoplasma TaxID=295320 RepID=UPI001265D0F7|nr:30S ribosomal protein S17 ['Cynodon dactylon' phytoplasma]KAB8121978.1 30S ribosomal protein S17 ['Cynodon dactylon' phytoplasma]WIA07608.1 MAG: 30S ribosomal protein S17 [Candidatus Phytoplasma cynodontis]
MRNSRKILKGYVVSDKMDKTITVAVDYYKKHFLYDKKIKKTSKFYVHDETEVAKVGYLVEFIETRPLSKNKRFRLLNILHKDISKNIKNKEVQYDSKK